MEGVYLTYVLEHDAVDVEQLLLQVRRDATGRPEKLRLLGSSLSLPGSRHFLRDAALGGVRHAQAHRHRRPGRRSGRYQAPDARRLLVSVSLHQLQLPVRDRGGVRRRRRIPAERSSACLE